MVAYDLSAYTIVDANGKPRSSGVWLTQSNAEAAAAALDGFAEVREVPVNDAPAP